MSTIDNVSLIQDVMIISSVLSNLGCFYILLTYLFIKQLRENIFYKSLMVLIILDIIVGFLGYAPFIFPVEDGNTSCQIIAFIDNTLRIASIIWTSLFAYSLKKVYTQGINKAITMNQILIFCLMIPGLISSIGLFADWYGSSIYWCWVRASLSRWMQFGLNMVFFGIFWICLFVDIIIYSQIHIILKRNRQINFEFYKLLLFPTILVACFLFGFFNRILISCFEYVNTYLCAIAIFLFQIQGFLNAIVYGLNQNVIDNVSQSVKSFFNKGNKSNSDDYQNHITRELIDSSKSNSLIISLDKMRGGQDLSVFY